MIVEEKDILSPYFSARQTDADVEENDEPDFGPREDDDKEDEEDEDSLDPEKEVIDPDAIVGEEDADDFFDPADVDEDDDDDDDEEEEEDDFGASEFNDSYSI